MAGEGAHELMLWGGGQAGPVGGLHTRTDAQLDELSTLGGSPGTGFTWGYVGHMFLTGTVAFTGGPAPANTSTKNYDIQRYIQGTNIVNRCHAASGSSRAGKNPIKVYLHMKLCPTTTPPLGAPIRPWFTDSAWDNDTPGSAYGYCQRVRDVYAFARWFGFDGICEDGETFEDPNAWWWDYPGNPGEYEVRSKAAQRGREVMTAALEGWGADDTLDLHVYHPFCPDAWATTNSMLAAPNNADNARLKKSIRPVEWNYLGGRASIEGYKVIRHDTAGFQKGYGFGTHPTRQLRWGNAMKFDQNVIFAHNSGDPEADNGLRKGWENWEYASARFKSSFECWLDEPSIGNPPGTGSWRPHDDKKPPSIIMEQLIEMRKWAMGGQYTCFDFSGFDAAFSFYGPSWYWDGSKFPVGHPQAGQDDYSKGFYEEGFDFRPMIQAGTTPGIVDTQPPVLSPVTISATELTGTTVDHRTTVGDMDGAIKRVAWTDNLGGTGVAELDFVIDSGQTGVQVDGYVHPELWIKVWHMDWTIKRSDLTPGATSVTITSEDTHDRLSTPRVVSVGTPTDPDPVNGPVLDLKWDLRARVATTFVAPRELKWDLQAPVIPSDPDVDQNQTRLWSGADKIMSQNQQLYFDAGFTSFIYSVGYMPGLPGGGLAGSLSPEQSDLFDNVADQDYSNSFVGVYLDTFDTYASGGNNILGDWFDDAKWTNDVLPAIQSITEQSMDAGFHGMVLDAELYTPQDASRPAGSPNLNLYSQPYWWTWQKVVARHPTQTEATVRAKVRQRGAQFGAALVAAGGQCPVLMYHFDYKDSLTDLRTTNPNYHGEDTLFIDWCNGMVFGGMNLTLIDSDFYKDDVAPGKNFGDANSSNPTTAANTWKNSLAYQVTNLDLHAPALSSRLEPFVWLTNGPNATQAVNRGYSLDVLFGVAPHPDDHFGHIGEEYAIWDRQRSVAGYPLHAGRITGQLDGLRNSPHNPNRNVTVYAYNLVGGAQQYDDMAGFPGTTTSGPVSVTATKTLKWDTRTRVNGSVLDLKYDLYRRLTLFGLFGKLHKWDVRSSVNGPVTRFKWDLGGGVNGGVVDARWDLRAAVARTQTLKYDLRAFRTLGGFFGFQFLWDMGAEGQVNAGPLRLVTDLAAEIDGSLTAAWDMGAEIEGLERSLVWDAPAGVDAPPAALVWGVQGPVDGDEAELLWHIAGPAIAELQMPWQVYAAVDAGEVDVAWDWTEAVDGAELIVVWDQADPLDSSLTVFWDVLVLHEPFSFAAGPLPKRAYEDRRKTTV